MKKIKTLYWICFGLFALSILAGAAMYLLEYQKTRLDFEALGFPSFIVIPLALAKILGIATILYGKSRTLTEWAYAGFTFNLLTYSRYGWRMVRSYNCSSIYDC